MLIFSDSVLFSQITVTSYVSVIMQLNCNPATNIQVADSAFHTSIVPNFNTVRELIKELQSSQPTETDTWDLFGSKRPETGLCGIFLKSG